MHFILRFGEISLKGKNRNYFEKVLRRNIKEMFSDCKFRKAGGRYYVECEEEHDFRRIFGIVSYSQAVKTGMDYDEMEEAVLEEAEGHKGTFALDAHRLNKQYNMTSMDLNRDLGQAVVDEYGLEVDLDNPDLKIGIEVANDAAYVYNDTIRCFGGLPVGVEGKAASWIEDEKGLLAALLMMKRGCEVIPYGPEEQDVSLLECFGCRNGFITGSIADAGEMNVQALSVGDSLKEFKEYNVSIPVLRPLIGLTEQQIRDKMDGFSEVLR